MKKIILVCVALLFPVTSIAEDNPENYIKYRKAVMKAIGGHMGASSQIVRGKITSDAALSLHSKALADLNMNLTKLFPEGSDFGETRAKESIWDDWAKFEAAAKKGEEATAAFSTAVRTGDSEKIKAAFKEVGKSCKGCHKEYRKKEEEHDHSKH